MPRDLIFVVKSHARRGRSRNDSRRACKYACTHASNHRCACTKQSIGRPLLSRCPPAKKLPRKRVSFQPRIYSRAPTTLRLPYYPGIVSYTSARCYDTRSPLKNIRTTGLETGRIILFKISARRQIRQINSAILKVPDAAWIR